jgi:hypothetical protein
MFIIQFSKPTGTLEKFFYKVKTSNICREKNKKKDLLLTTNEHDLYGSDLSDYEREQAFEILRDAQIKTNKNKKNTSIKNKTNTQKKTHEKNTQNSTQTNTQSEIAIESNSITNLDVVSSNPSSSVRSYCSCKKSGTHSCKTKCECAKLSLQCIPDHCSCGGPNSNCCSPIISDVSIQRSNRQANQNITYINENIETNSHNEQNITHVQHENKIQYQDDHIIIKNCSDLFVHSDNGNQLFKTSQGFIRQYKMRMKQTNQLHKQQIQLKDQHIEQLNLQIKTWKTKFIYNNNK